MNRIETAFASAWRSLIALALVAALAAMPAGLASVSANAAVLPWHFVSAADGSDAGNNCTDQYAPCATIQHAIDEASAGDSVDVAPGIYAEDLTIDKPLTLRSQGGIPTYWYEPETRIDGGAGTAIKVEGNAVQISGFEVSTAGTAPVILASGAKVDNLRVEEDVISGGSSGVYFEAGGEKDTIGFDVIEGTGDGIHLSGDEYSHLAIKWNQFEAPIDEYAVLADSGGTIEGFRLEGNEMSAPIRIAARVDEAPPEESELYGNTFESTAGPQLAVDAAQLRVFDNSFEGHGSAGCLQILGNEGGMVPSEHILVSLHNEFIDCNPYGIELGPEVDHITIYGSDFPGTYDGIVASGASPWDVTGHVLIQTNRFVGTTHLGVDNEASGTLDAEQNWWGCNAGPGAAGCDGVSNGVDAANNAVLTGLIGPLKPETGIEELPTGTSITLDPGEKAEVAALLPANGLGINNGIPTDKTPIGFSSTLGTLSPTSNTLSNGWTKSVFTAGGTPGHGSIVLSLDNAQTLVPVTITGPSPSNASPPSISGSETQGYTLTEVHGTWANNPTTYSYQWQLCDSSGNDCSAISGATFQSYVLTEEDVGHTIRVQESATNVSGIGGPVISSATGVVQETQTAIGRMGAGRARAHDVIVWVPLKCTGPTGASCKVTLAMYASRRLKRRKLIVVGAVNRKRRIARRILRVGRNTVWLRTGHRRTARVKLNTTGRRLLKAHHNLSVNLTIAQATSNDTHVISRQRVVFKTRNH